MTDGVDGVAVERLNTGEVSCLHDYTLTVTDMKKIETADIIALNGADLEEFMEDALAASSALVIDCSEGVSLLENADHVHTEGDDGHDHGHYDPHYWMDPDNMAQVVENLYAGLNQADPDHQEQYRENAVNAMTDVSNFGVMAREILSTALEENGWSSPAWSPSTTASATSPSSWTCPCWPPSRRRRAARPAPRRSMRSQPL